MNEIINTASMKTMSAPKFKNDVLNQATLRISEIYKDAAKFADTKNREIAQILGEVLDKKAYEKDGFSSVADYANKTFGIARQNAYALANAGRVYNDKNAHPELKSMTPSKIAELASIDADKVKAALDAGTIKHNSTQKELREFADKAKAENNSEKPVVLDYFTARPCMMYTDERLADSLSLPRTMDEWDEFLTGYVIDSAPSASATSTVEIVSLPKGKFRPTDKKATLNRRLYFNRGFSVVVEFFKYTPEKKSKTETPKYTKEQLLEMLAQLDGPHDNDEKVAEKLSK